MSSIKDVGSEAASSGNWGDDDDLDDLEDE